MPALRSRVTTHGRNAAGARALWRATGMGEDDFGKPIVAIANSYTQFVPGHVHLKDLGEIVARGCGRPAGCPASSTPSRLTMGSRWATEGCCTPCRPGERALRLLVDDDVLAERRAKMDASERPWQPVDRQRPVAKSLRAYARMATSAATGAVRDPNR